MSWTILICTVVNLVGSFIFYKKLTTKPTEVVIAPPVIQQQQLSLPEIEDIINYSVGKTNAAIDHININLAKLPTKIVESITGNISNQKGKVGELIAYLSLNAEYDRLIALGNFVDFIGIRFPTENDPGIISFIDIKNGKSARLSTDQKFIKGLITDKRIEFVTHKVMTEITND
jgi:predicted Holliday junction resolvase-like endonuclease